MKLRRTSVLFFAPLLTPSPTLAHPSSGSPRMEISGLSCEPHNWAAPSRSHHHPPSYKYTPAIAFYLRRL